MNDKADGTALPGGCRLISVPEMKDMRGSLAFMQGGQGIPFAIERVFWIWGVPEGCNRGGHAHRTCHEVVFALKGSFTMHVDDGRTQADILIDGPTRGILIPAGVWCCLTDFQPGTVCLAVASQPYIPEGYINSHEDYLREVNATK